MAYNFAHGLSVLTFRLTQITRSAVYGLRKTSAVNFIDTFSKVRANN